MKKLNIFTKPGAVEHSFHVWSDLSEIDLEGIPGVEQITSFDSSKAHFIIYIDPRYDENEVLAEINRLADAPWRTMRAGGPPAGTLPKQ